MRFLQSYCKHGIRLETDPNSTSILVYHGLYTPWELTFLSIALQFGIKGLMIDSADSLVIVI